jgi:hypothetical protein
MHMPTIQVAMICATAAFIALLAAVVVQGRNNRGDDQ